MTRKVVLILTIIAIAGCAGFTPEYEDRLRRSTEYPRGVEMLSSNRYPGKILCGEYATWENNRMVRRTRPYVIGPDFVLPRATKDEVAVFCTRDSQSALFERFGIGGPDSDWSQLKKVSDDLMLLRAAIDDYYNVNYTLPRSLTTLVSAEVGVLEANVTDPWGFPYRYEGGIAGRSKPNPKLSTYGADGTSGGSGTNADVTLAEVRLLHHVLTVRGD